VGTERLEGYGNLTRAIEDGDEEEAGMLGRTRGWELDIMKVSYVLALFLNLVQLDILARKFGDCCWRGEEGVSFSEDDIEVDIMSCVFLRSSSFGLYTLIIPSSSLHPLSLYPSSSLTRPSTSPASN
jgi:hypothetical protein